MDKYDKQIAELMQYEGDEFREKVRDDWGACTPLFQPVYSNYTANVECGCLTQIKDGSGFFKAFKNGNPDEQLTQEIINDVRIPRSPREITKESLPVFAEWQRKIDKLYGRE